MATARCEEPIQRCRRGGVGRSPSTRNPSRKPAVVVLADAEYERLRLAEKAKAPTFAELLLAMPQDGGEFERLPLKPRDFDF